MTDWDKLVEIIRQWDKAARHEHGSGRLRGCARCETHTRLAALGRNCILHCVEALVEYKIDEIDGRAMARKALALVAEQVEKLKA